MEASDLLDLIAKADTQQFERDIQKLERIVDVGDRLIAQQAVLLAAKEEKEVEGSDPTNP